MGFSKEEKARIRAHLGYGNYTAGSTFFLGTPAAVETAFLIEPAMDRVLPEAEGLVRSDLAELDDLVAQLKGTKENVEVDQIDELKLNALFERRWSERYDFFQGSLANHLGVPPNPFDKRRGTVQGGGVSVRVRG